MIRDCSPSRAAEGSPYLPSFAGAVGTPSSGCGSPPPTFHFPPGTVGRSTLFVSWVSLGPPLRTRSQGCGRRVLPEGTNFFIFQDPSGGTAKGG